MTGQFKHYKWETDEEFEQVFDEMTDYERIELWNYFETEIAKTKTRIRGRRIEAVVLAASMIGHVFLLYSMVTGALPGSIGLLLMAALFCADICLSCKIRDTYGTW